jgi:putative Mn2+ efflux pump MntP
VVTVGLRLNLLADCRLVLKLLAFVLPLAVDSFAVAALLGASALTRAQRWRITGLFVVFEAGMPLVGLALGAPLARAIGSAAGYAAAAALIGLGTWMLLWDEDGEDWAAERLASASGWAMLGLGTSISLDELAIGFGLGLVALPTVPVIVAIAVQAFLAAQLGLALGKRVGQRPRESAERAAALALIGLGLFVLTERLARH